MNVWDYLSCSYLLLSVVIGLAAAYGTNRNTDERMTFGLPYAIRFAMSFVVAIICWPFVAFWSLLMVPLWGLFGGQGKKDD